MIFVYIQSSSGFSAMGVYDQETAVRDRSRTAAARLISCQTTMFVVVLRINKGWECRMSDADVVIVNRRDYSIQGVCSNRQE